MFIRIFVLDSLSEPINNNILFQKLNFPAARMKVLELPWNQKMSPGIYIQYTLYELHEVLDLRNQREMFAIEFRVCLDFLKVLRFSFLVPRQFSRSLARFAVENIKNLPLALRAREKLRAQLVGKSRVCLKKVCVVWDKTDLSFCQLDFPGGKMVSYSKVKECHLDLSSLKRSAAFVDKLEIDDLSLNYFLKTIVCCFIT